MCQSDKSRYGELLNLLANVFFRSEENDVHILKPSPSGNFSMKSFYLALEGPPQPRSPFILSWLCLAPTRVEPFCLIVIMKCLLSTF